MNLNVKAVDLFNYNFKESFEALSNIRKILVPYVNYIDHLSYLQSIKNPSLVVGKYNMDNFIRNRIVHTYVNLQEFNSKRFLKTKRIYLDDFLLTECICQHKIGSD